MSKRFFTLHAAKIGSLIAALLMLPACSYDYWQHTDRVAFGAGNAVKANLEQSTTNPSSKQMNSTTGLGKNGTVLPASQEEDSYLQEPIGLIDD